MKEQETERKDHPKQAGVVHAPDNAIELGKQPEQRTDQATVQQVEEAVNHGTALAQIPG